MANSHTVNLNLPKPAEGDVVWKDEEDAVKEAVDDIGNLFAFVVPMVQSPEVDLIFYDGFQPSEEITLIALSIYAITGPTGSALTIDVLKDSVAETNEATLADGSNHQRTTLVPSINFTPAQRMGFKVTGVGSTEPGNDVYLTIYYRKKSITTIP